MSTRIVVYHRDAAAYVAALKRRIPDANVVGIDDPDRLREVIGATEVLVTHVLPLDVLGRAERLRWIQATSAGTEFLAPASARLANVLVTNARGVHADTIADYVMTAAVMLHSDFPAFIRNQDAKRWQRRPVQTLAGKTIGIVGLGAIGCEIAKRAATSGMRVLGVRRSAEPVAHVDGIYPPDRLGECLSACDFVVLAVPATDATRAFFGRDALGAMRKTAYLINIARGSVVDEAALVEALARGTIAGACLDVFATEPLPESSPLWTLPNVIVTPHIAGMRVDYEERLMDIFVDNLARFERGAALRNVVAIERGY